MNCTPKIEHNFGSAVFLSKLYLFNKIGTNYNRRLAFYVNMFLAQTQICIRSKDCIKNYRIEE